jgi:ferredoxin-type protein NapH
MTLKQSKATVKTAFFVLFLFVPLLDIFRFDFDFDLGHFIIFGQA